MKPDLTDDFFKIGVITNSVGLKGELRVYPTTDVTERFSALTEVYTRDAGGAMELFPIERVRYQKGLAILKLKGVDDVDAALRLKTRELVIPPELALPLGEGEYYHRDLIGMRVVDADNENAELGVISGILETGANDVYIVRRAAGGDVLIPAVRHVVLSVDTAGKIMTVRLPSGLLEL